MKKIILTSLIGIVFTTILSAQCEVCNQALQKDIIYLDYSSLSNEHLLQIVDASNFSEKQLELQTQKHYEATYKIYSGILKDSKNYAEFEQKRSSYYNSVNFSSTKQTSIQYFENKMNLAGYNSYDNCINRCSGKPGLYLTIKNSSDCQISLSLEYIAAQTDQSAVLVIDSGNVSFINGIPLSNSAKKLMNEKTTLINGSKMEFTVQKTDNKNPLFIEINGRINNFAIPASLKIPASFHYEAVETEKTAEIILATDSNCTTQKCKGLTNISKVEIISFEASGRTASHPDGGACNEGGYVADKQHPAFNSLQFGEWNNHNCTSVQDQTQYQGKGWHANVGSCCRTGNQVGKVNSVKVLVTYKDIYYKKVPTGCN